MSINLQITEQQLRARRGVKWTSFDSHILPAFIADMDFPIAEPIKDAVRDVLDREDVGYVGRSALDDIAADFAGRMHRRYQWSPDPALVQSVGDLIQPLRSCVELFTEPGQGVIIQTPIYHPFLDVVEELGRTLVDNPLRRTEQRFEMDLDGLSQNIRPDTRLLMFCNPHNPSGRVFERDELQALADIAIEHDLLVISDEVHADLTYPGQQHIPLASISGEIAARTITLTSATKAFNIAGMKYALAHFPTAALMQYHVDHYHPRLLGVPSVFGIEATRAAWRDCDEWLEAVMTQLDENRRFIAEFLDERLPQISYRMPQAGYLFWLDCSELKLPQRAYEFFLEQAGVACSDGDEFSAYTQQCVRLNFATTPAILSDIMSRIADAVDSVS